VSLARDDDMAVLRVRDDGFGIPKNMLESVFDLFVQCRSTIDRAAGGLGLGLTLVRSLVNMHGGTVSAQSEGEGKGAELVVRLPLALAAPKETSSSSLQTQIRVPAGAKVVVVEDNQDSRELLRHLLESAGYACRTADTGSKGLALIDEFRPHVALVDVGLPELDGFEIARRVRGDASHGDTRLVALTGYGRAEDRDTAAKAGFDAHLVKPVDPMNLLALLGHTGGLGDG
jgi:two-component system CheB/CheR fusion protein